MSPRYHISKDDLRRLRDELWAARNLQTDKVGSARLMDRLIRMANERRR